MNHILKMRRSTTIIWLFLLVVAAVYITQIRRTVRYDEAFTFFHYAHSPLTALFNYTLPNNHQLHSFLVWVSTSFIGDSLIGLRFPALAAALLTVAQLYRFTCRIAGASAGLIAATLLATSTVFAGYAVDSRGYALSLLLLLILAEQLYFRPQCIGRWDGYRFLLLALLLTITIPSMLVLTAGLLLWLGLDTYRTRMPVRQISDYGMPLIIGSISAIFFFIPSLLNQNTVNQVTSFGYQDPLLLLADWWQQIIQTTPGWGIVLGVGVLAGGNRLRRHFPRVFTLLGCVLITAVILALLQGVVTGRFFYPRNYLYLLPLVAAAAGIGWEHLLRGNTRLLYAAIILLLAAGLLQIPRLSDPTDVDRAIAAIDQHAQREDNIVPGCCIDFPLFYHYRNTNYLDGDLPGKRVVFIPTRYDPFEEMMMPDYCHSDQWGEFAVIICTLLID